MQFVYLDQCHWINLAKAEAGKADGKRFAPILAAARAAVRDRTVCFPLSAVHFKETARAPVVRQRKLLARLMTELSQGVVLRTPRQMVEDELRHAVRRTFELANLELALLPFGRGIEAAFNIDISVFLRNKSPAWTERMRQSLDTPAAFIDYLSQRDEQTRKRVLGRMNLISTRFADARLQDRGLLRDTDPSERKRVFAARMTLHFQEPLQTALREVGKRMEDWASLGPDKLTDFWYGIPSVRVVLELEEALLLEKDKTPKPNDLDDLEYLGMAVPHCDIVATEKFWHHHIKRRKLDAEFRTVVLRDLTELSIPHGSPSKYDPSLWITKDTT